MINHDVTHDVGWLLSLFDIKIITIVSSVFAIYFAFQKLTKKVIVSYTVTGDMLYDSYISGVMLSNKRDNTISICKIYATISGYGTILISSFETPMLIKGYDSIYIKTPPQTYMSPTGVSFEIPLFPFINFKIITVDNEEITCSVGNKKLKIIEDEIPPVKRTFNGITLSDSICYIFPYLNSGLKKNLVIDHHGYLHNDNPFNGNKIDGDIEFILKSLLVESGYHEYIGEYSLYKKMPTGRFVKIFDNNSISRDIRCIEILSIQ